MNRILLASLAAAVLAAPLSSQTSPVTDQGVSMGQWHLNTRDVEAAKKLFVTLGGTPAKEGPYEVVRFPHVDVYLNLGANAAAATGGTVGSNVNHLGFSVKDLAEASARWKAAGYTVEPGNGGRTDQAWITTAEQVRLEFLEDKNQPEAIRHHHVHMMFQRDAVPEVQAWYAKVFHAQPGMRANFQAGDLPGANLTFGANDNAQTATRGRVLDHIGFRVENLEAFTKRLEAEGIKLDRGYHTDPATGRGHAFLTDPWGTFIELTERSGSR